MHREGRHENGMVEGEQATGQAGNSSSPGGGRQGRWQVGSSMKSFQAQKSGPLLLLQTQ